MWLLEGLEMTEREMFEEKYKELTGCDDFSLSRKKDGDYKFDGAFFGWLMWQASANREGYKLVPLEPTKAMLRELSSNDMNGRMIYKAMINAAD